MTPELTLYARSECHLCREMQEQLRPLAAAHGFSVHVIDIDGNPELGARYGLKIPVLMAGEHEICHYTLDSSALIRYLEGGRA